MIDWNTLLRGTVAVIAGVVGPSALAASCSVTSPGISFGAYDPLRDVDTNGTGSIQLACDEPVTATVILARSGPSLDRMMTNGISQLVYGLYADPQRNTIWGDGMGGSQTVTVQGTSISQPVYGKILKRQQVTAGSYNDTITVTISY